MLRAQTGGEGDLTGALADDWRAADVSDGLRALLAYAEKLTRASDAMEEADVRRLRDAGWSDEAVLCACQVVACFSFVNRTADGLGVRPEVGWEHPTIPLTGGGPSKRADDG